jgi:hypothetical protein
MGELAPVILFADRQARSGVMAAPWANGKNAKEYRSTMGNEAGRRHCSASAWRSLTAGRIPCRRPGNPALGARRHRQRTAALVHEILGHALRPALASGGGGALRLALPQRALPAATSAAGARGLVYSQQTAQYYGGERAQQKVEDHTLGYYQALIEARIPSRWCTTNCWTPPHLDPFKVLIFPNIAAISDAQCGQIREFVARGGSIVATLRDLALRRMGRTPADFGLASICSARPLTAAGSTRACRTRTCAWRPTRSTGKRHPSARGPGRRRAHHQRRVARPHPRHRPRYRNTAADADSLLPGSAHGRSLSARAQRPISRKCIRAPGGAGRVVYFPWDIDRTFWEVLAADHGKLLRNAVDWATNEPRPVTVTGPGVLDVTVWRQKDSMTVHLVNLTNPMMMKGPLREFIPTPPQYAHSSKCRASIASMKVSWSVRTATIRTAPSLPHGECPIAHAWSIRL